MSPCVETHLKYDFSTFTFDITVHKTLIVFEEKKRENADIINKVHTIYMKNR